MRREQRKEEERREREGERRVRQPGASAGPSLKYSEQELTLHYFMLVIIGVFLNEVEHRNS